ncbi:MAG: hypothetical protein K2K48_01110 [Anaeroplasmataceae bacterium]|nr:hypothetical protein [Anaeroplasmataceae bacterium]MDE6413989.1 hypothetical protein [Anaeroplasmataceae bacterium]
MGKIDRYIKLKKTISIPEVQKESGQNYRLIHALFIKLVERGQLKKSDELFYTYIKSDEDPLNIYALWLCIKEKQSSSKFLQQKLLIDDCKAKEIESWMLKNKYKKAGIFSEDLISKEKFLSIYGPLDWDKTDLSAFDTWTVEDPEDFKKIMKKVETKNSLFTFEEYYQVLEGLIKSNTTATKNEFIQVIEKQYQEYQKDKKMMAILVKLMEEVVSMDETKFAIYKFSIVF